MTRARDARGRSPGDFALRALATAIAPGGRDGRLSILIYHRVIDDGDPLNTWDPTVQQFDEQMRIVAACLTPLPLSEAAARLANGDLPPRAVSVTFDDGYADNVRAALPILVRHSVPATFFIASGYLDGGRMWNDRVVEAVRAHPDGDIDLRPFGLPAMPLQGWAQRRAVVLALLPVLKHLAPAEREARVAELEAASGAQPSPGPMMRADDVRTLRRAGMEIGAHTVTHPILTRLSESQARDEIVGSRDRLAAIVGEPISLFAYPNGKPGADYSASHVRMVKEAGFRAAVSTAPGAARRGSDPWQLPRFTPWQRRPLRFALALLANRRHAPGATA